MGVQCCFGEGCVRLSFALRVLRVFTWKSLFRTGCRAHAHAVLHHWTAAFLHGFHVFIHGFLALLEVSDLHDSLDFGVVLFHVGVHAH